MPISYATVFDEKFTRLAEYPKSTDATTAPNIVTYAEVTAKIAATMDAAKQRRRTIDDTENKSRYCCFSNGEGRIIVAVSTLDTAARTSFALLDAVEPLVRCPAEQLRNGKKLLQMKIDFYNNPQNDKIAALAHEVDLVIDTMSTNVEAALKRGELIDALSQKSTTLAEQAKQFQSKSTDVKYQMFTRNIKTIVFVILGLFGAALLIALISCRPDFSAC